MFFVYLLESISIGRRYVGSTNDLQKRLAEHNSGRSTYTKTLKDWAIVYNKSFSAETDARSFERRIKKNKKYRQQFYLEADLHGLPV